MRLAQTLHREPLPEEVAEAMDATIEELENVTAAVLPHVELLEGLESPERLADERLERGQLARRLAAAVGQLTQRLQVLLSLHYVEGFTYREIAKMLEVAAPRVCQLHAEAVEKLRVGSRRVDPEPGAPQPGAGSGGLPAERTRPCAWRMRRQAVLPRNDLPGGESRPWKLSCFKLNG